MPDQETGNKRTIFILYIPGGAMLGLIPAMMLSRLEELTETSAGHLFQVVDGVSTGAILAGGMSIRDPENLEMPKISGEKSVHLFEEIGPKFFPEMHNRMLKMGVGNAMNLIEDYLDPAESDKRVIRRMHIACEKLAEALEETDQKTRATKLERIITSRWLTKKNKNYALKMCGELREKHEELADIIDHISGLLSVRSPTGLLGRIFRQSVLSSAKMVKKAWAHDYLYSSDVPREHFQDILGQQRLSDSLQSIYISTYDLRNHKRHTFFSRKEDFFSTDPDTPSVTSEHNHKIWDVVMASIANPFAFSPHVTEDGILCGDKAPVHTPLTSVIDVMNNKPDDADVRLVILGTGTYLNKPLDPDSEDDLALLATEMSRTGIIGSLVKGKEIQQLESYVMSSAREAVRKTLGPRNIIEFNPPLSPRADDELDMVPNTDVLDASEDNIRRIKGRTAQYIRENDLEFRKLALLLAENCHNIGRMDDAKYERVKAKIMEGMDTVCLDDLRKPGEQPGAKHGLSSTFSFIASWLGLRAADEQDNNPDASDKPANEDDNTPPKRTGTDDPAPRP